MEKTDEGYLESIEKIRCLLEKYPNIGFYINQIADTVLISRQKVECILEKANWVDKKGKRYYYRDNFEEECRNMSFYQEDVSVSVSKNINIYKEDNRIEEDKLKLLEDPGQLIKLLKKERGIIR